MTSNADRVAEIQVLKQDKNQAIKVVVPKGTPLTETVKLHDVISEITKGLNGCPACNSGVPIFIDEREEIQNIVRVDLDSMKRM